MAEKNHLGGVKFALSAAVTLCSIALSVKLTVKFLPVLNLHNLKIALPVTINMPVTINLLVGINLPVGIDLPVPIHKEDFAGRQSMSANASPSYGQPAGQAPLVQPRFWGQMVAPPADRKRPDRNMPATNSIVAAHTDAVATLPAALPKSVLAPDSGIAAQPSTLRIPFPTKWPTFSLNPVADSEAYSQKSLGQILPSATAIGSDHPTTDVDSHITVNSIDIPEIWYTFGMKDYTNYDMPGLRPSILPTLKKCSRPPQPSSQH